MSWFEHFSTSEDSNVTVPNCGAVIDHPTRQYCELWELARPCPKCLAKVPQGTIYVSRIVTGQEDEEARRVTA